MIHQIYTPTQAIETIFQLAKQIDVDKLSDSDRELTIKLGETNNLDKLINLSRVKLLTWATLLEVVAPVLAGDFNAVLDNIIPQIATMQRSSTSSLYGVMDTMHESEFVIPSRALGIGLLTANRVRLDVIIHSQQHDEYQTQLCLETYHGATLPQLDFGLFMHAGLAVVLPNDHTMILSYMTPGKIEDRSLSNMLWLIMKALSVL